MSALLAPCIGQLGEFFPASGHFQPERLVITFFAKHDLKNKAWRCYWANGCSICSNRQRAGRRRVDRQGHRPGPICLTLHIGFGTLCSSPSLLLQQSNVLQKSGRSQCFAWTDRVRLCSFSGSVSSPKYPMSTPSPARRVRSRFMSFSLWTSLAAFVLIEGYALIDQIEIGHASIVFMLGTALFAAAACIGLFAIIMAIGLAIC
jgi:hypothetical protein